MASSRLSSRALEQLLGTWRGPAAAYLELADAVRLLSLDRRIVPGTALPAERDLAARLGLSRTTVAAAYRALRESGHISSVRGSGSIVRAVGRVAPEPAPGGAATIDLHQASPPAWDGLGELYTGAMADLGDMLAGSGYEMVGLPALREAIAARYSARGLRTTPDQIVVTTGAQSAIALVADVVARRGDRAAIETPTYPHAAEVLRARGTHPVTIPVDPRGGWDMERAVHVFRRSAPSIAYLMPDFQNPTGASMAAEDRTTILEAAREAGVVLVVDETTADLAIDGAAGGPPFGVGADPHLLGGLVTLGSLGKTVWGGLRIGWIRADQDLVARLVTARPHIDLGTPDLEQRVALAAFDRMPEILEARRRTLGQSRDRLIEGLRGALPEWDVPTPAGGVSLWCSLGAPVSSRLALAARDRGVVLSSGPRFGVDGGHERHIRIPFTARPEVLDDAVLRIADAWADVRSQGWVMHDPLLAVV